MKDSGKALEDFSIVIKLELHVRLRQRDRSTYTDPGWSITWKGCGGWVKKLKVVEAVEVRGVLDKRSCPRDGRVRLG
ncbi:MAG: hypothetical protein M5R42_06180 [Rhodocyclaceae bacterium]|nr:hypothetical protein [Rhodocyclaceae bacterium]